MTSYQKLKLKCERLQNQVDIFKDALTVVETKPILEFNDRSLTAHMSYAYSIISNKVDEEIKRKLNEWVAFNLDEKTIMRLLKLKKELDK